MKRERGKFLIFCEYVLVFIILAVFCCFINKDIKILGLYMDDLYNWSYYPETNFFTFAFKFYEGSTRYRPFYDAMQYLEYVIVAHKPIVFTYINLILNSMLALFVYHFSKKMNAGWFVGLLASGMYVLSHFSYYQIGQSTGLIESMALFISLLILYKSISYVGKKDDTTYVTLLILYFMMAFTHERFLSMYGVIVFAIIFSEMINKTTVTNKQKLQGINARSAKVINVLFKIFVLSTEVVIILFIRKLAIGKVVPAGTGGTYVEDTFNIKQMIGFCINQVQYILGMNKGPQHLCGIDFSSLDPYTRYFTILHMVLMMIFMFVYLVVKIIYVINKKQLTKIERDKNAFSYFIENFYVDILFVEFIVFAIVFSSVTIRVEMRFIYVSFTATMIYLAYMIGYIKNIPYESKDMGNVVKALCIVCCILIVGLRVPCEKVYRDNYDYIYFFVDQNRMNSLANNTVYKYGEDIIDKKQVYIIANNYNMSKFYGDYFFQIYQKDYELRPIIFITDPSDINDIDFDNSIVLKESADMLGYEPYINGVD